MGMDVLESAYPWFLSSQGLAISFPVSYEGDQPSGQHLS